MENQLVALITDLHLGIKKANKDFLNSQILFINNQFVPYLKKYGIKKIYFLGDLNDNRTHMNIMVKNVILDLFEHTLKDFECNILCGNHDIYDNESLDVNGLRYLDYLSNVKIIDSCETIDINGKKVFMVPWVLDKKLFQKQVIDNDIRADICFGHFDINGFRLNKTNVEEHGLDATLFSRFEKTFSGHFHIRHTRDYGENQIIYIGSCYQLNRGDADEARGFCILNTDTLEYEFIDNELSMKYVNLNYPENFTREMIKGNHIDLNVIFDENLIEEDLNKYIKRMEEYNPIDDPTIIPINKFLAKANEQEYEVKSSEQLLKDYINNSEIENKDDVYDAMQKLHEEALNTI